VALMDSGAVIILVVALVSSGGSYLAIMDSRKARRESAELKKQADQAEAQRSAREQASNQVGVVEQAYGAMLDRQQSANERIIKNLERELDRMQRELDGLRQTTERTTQEYAQENAEQKRRIAVLEATVERMRQIMRNADIPALDDEAGR
jgi:predicted RNase H-like nuclease (RuvC/YqgF family)